MIDDNVGTDVSTGTNSSVLTPSGIVRQRGGDGRVSAALGNADAPRRGRREAGGLSRP